jgi:PAS domain S-box-containing protein
LLQESSVKATDFEKIIDKQYQAKLFSMVAKYRYEREKELLFGPAKVIELINISNQKTLVLTIAILITSILVYSLILGSILKFITHLTEAVYKIKQGKLDTRLNITSKDELGILASMFNQMMDDLNITIISRFYIDNIITSMTDTLIVINSNTIITKVNLATSTLLGYQEAELVGKPIKLILSQEENDKKLWIHELIGKGSITNIERIYLTKDSRKIPVSLSASVMRNDSGEMQGIVCVAQDISDAYRQATQRKRVEETNLLLATAIEYAADAIEITDTEAKFEYVNPAFEKTTGYTRAEVVGKTSASLLRSGKHDAAFYQQMSNTISSGKIWSGTYIGKRKDGSLYYQEATISPVCNSAGKIIHHVAVKRDIGT